MTEPDGVAYNLTEIKWHIVARRLSMILFSVMLLTIPLTEFLSGNSFAQGEGKKGVVLKASEITPKIFADNWTQLRHPETRALIGAAALSPGTDAEKQLPGKTDSCE